MFPPTLQTSTLFFFSQPPHVCFTCYLILPPFIPSSRDVAQLIFSSQSLPRATSPFFPCFRTPTIRLCPHVLAEVRGVPTVLFFFAVYLPLFVPRSLSSRGLPPILNQAGRSVARPPHPLVVAPLVPFPLTLPPKSKVLSGRQLSPGDAQIRTHFWFPPRMPCLLFLPRFPPSPPSLEKCLVDCISFSAILFRTLMFPASLTTQSANLSPFLVRVIFRLIDNQVLFRPFCCSFVWVHLPRMFHF